MTQKIYTKVGDKGQSSLLSGTKVSKNHERLELYGTLDELNSWLGLVVSHLEKHQGLNQEKEFLLKIQRELFQFGSLLACEKEQQKKFSLKEMNENQVSEIELRIDKMTAEVGELSSFILPGGSRGASYVHLARTVCRRFERRLVAFGDNQQSEISKESLAYINRLSDYLFTLARLVNKSEGQSEKKVE